MNNKSPLPRKSDKQKPLVPSITINNQNSIQSKAGPLSGTLSTSDDDNIFDWSTPCTKKSDKRKNKQNSPTGTSPNPKQSNSTYSSKNRFSPLAQSNDVVQMETDTSSNIPQTKLPLPPPIFIKTDIIQFNLFCESIKQLTQPDGFLCKSSVNGLKLNTYTTDSYRKTVKFLKEKKVNFHTYQLKDEKSYRVVIRHLHHSTPVDAIKEELNSKGFTVRNIINVLHYQTKKPLPFFFVDLEPSPSNKDIFTIDTLYYTKIKIEEPRPRRNLIQCTRCQSYGHTQAYCNHQPRCVKCGDNHLSSECKKDKDSPANCALCTQPHPANYRGCQVHKDLQKFNRNSAPKSTLRDQNSKPNFVSTLSSSKDSSHQVVSSQINSNEKPSYAHTTSKRNTASNSDNHDSTVPQAPSLASFLEEFKSLITPLISLLTSLITKLFSHNDK